MRLANAPAVDTLFLGRARAALRTFDTSSAAILSMESEIVPPGLATTSPEPPRW
jgi:hypothetical protein